MKKFICSFISAILFMGLTGLSTGCTIETVEKEPTFTISTKTKDGRDSTIFEKSNVRINLGKIGSTDNDSINTRESEIINSVFSQVFGGISKFFLYPLIGFIFFIGIIFITLIVFLALRYTNKRSQYRLYTEAIKSGQNIPENLYLPKEEFNLESKGIKNIALGIGMGICFWIMLGYQIACIGFIPFCVGIGQILIHRSQNRKTSESKKAEE